eukprot:30884-Pelagococcus_subviridis.AAC.13
MADRAREERRLEEDDARERGGARGEDEGEVDAHEKERAREERDRIQREDARQEERGGGRGDRGRRGHDR